MDEIIHKKITDITPKHRKEHDHYEYYWRELVPPRKDGQCKISLYEIPPKQSAFPYHYHLKTEESFYMIKGEGLLKTPDGERTVVEGDFLFFPAGEKGAHKLTNISETEMLAYLDFDTHNDLDVAFYPDSGKIGIWGRFKGIGQLHKIDHQVEYYDGE